MGSFPPPDPFRVETDVRETEWLEPLLAARDSDPPIVGFIVPSGFASYARLLHPAQRFLGRSAEQRVPLRWSEIAKARVKTMHPEVELAALIDTPNVFDYEYWKAISTGGGEWFPPYEWLGEIDALTLVALLRSSTASTDGWFMLWDGYGDLGPGIDAVRGERSTAVQLL